jgi:hypothetical protein
MRPSRKYDEWESLIGKITKGMARAEAEQILGPPSRFISTGAVEITAYRSEKIGHAIYSILVAFENDQVSQCYLGFELSNDERR